MAKIWNAFDWNQARAFLAAAEYGSFSAAARELNMTQPTLSRQVSGLESDLGITLFERVGTGLLLTQAGERLLAQMQKMGDAAAEASNIAGGQAQAIEGYISITAADIFATHVLAPAIRDMRREAPNLQIEIISQNRISDLQRREADIAIRNIRPTQPDLIAKLIGESQGCIYGARAFIDAHGPFDTIDAVNKAPFIGSHILSEAQNILSGLGFDVPDQNFLSLSENGDVQLEMLKLGLGLGLTADFIGKAYPMLVPVMPEKTTLKFPLWIVAHRELATSAKMRFAFDFLDSWIKESGILV